MKMLTQKSVIFALILCLFIPCCTIKYYDTNKLLNDYKTEGFLDCDHFQVIVKGAPDKEKRGLVFKRDSALKDAKSRVNEAVVQSLVDYNVSHQIKKLNAANIKNIQNIEEVKKKLRAELNEYLQYGYIAFEYYGKNCSAVIVYRIYKDDLIDSIESIESEFLLKNPEENIEEEK